ncbi:MAG: hypothetical protein HFJ40_01235 [Clostridia bacterium]|nr:hypothetical protein [Clostridia bacterium]
MNECLEFRVPKFTKRERIELQARHIFNDEELMKIYLSKNQMEEILKKIEKTIGKIPN